MDCSHVHFQYSEDFSESDLDQLYRLFQAAAFWAKNRSMQEMAVAIANSHPVVTVWDQETLIGFARATSDGVYRATIWDVVIDPSYQGGGLGRKLVQTVLGHPHVSQVERVYLMTTHQQGFYERIGFQSNPSTTLVLFNQPMERELAPAWQGAEAASSSGPPN
ncbi:MAG: GNAT family N-acetyltransferase [Cyanobacteria bacterium Co-bin13]|nr:GNAT family N-acetyltransferase [Cyanobacteria bacterium Co-bin13]